MLRAGDPSVTGRPCGSLVPAWFRADSGTNLIKQGEIVTGRPCSSVVLARCAGDPGFESQSGHVLFPPLCHSVAQCGVRARATSNKGTVSSVPAWFRADSGTNLIKKGEIVTGRPCGSVAQLSECSHGMREVLGSSPGRAMCFFLPYGTSLLTCRGRHELSRLKTSRWLAHIIRE